MDEITRRAARRALRAELRTEIWQLTRLLELPAPDTGVWNEAALIETVVELRGRQARYIGRNLMRPGIVA